MGRRWGKLIKIAEGGQRVMVGKTNEMQQWLARCSGKCHMARITPFCSEAEAFLPTSGLTMYTAFERLQQK